MKRTIACLLTLTLALLSACAFAGDAHSYEGPGYATPEEAVEAYLEGIRAGDLDQMMAAFAIETYVDGYDLPAQLERMGAYIISMEIRFPNDNALMRALNVESRKNQIITGITYQQMGLVSEEWDFTTPLTLRGDNATQSVPELMALFEAAAQVDTSGVALVSFFEPEVFSDMYLSEKNQENMATQAAIYGADELRSMVAVFSLAGGQYLLCCDAIRYGDAWYMNGFSGNIGTLLGIPYMRAGVVPASALF